MWFERFRRPRWQHRNPKIRQEAVASLASADADGYATLSTLAVSDPAPAVRKSAVKRLIELDTLRERAEEDTDAGVREAARIRYSQLLAQGCDTLDLASRLAALHACRDAGTLARVARQGREEAIRVAALERLDDPRVMEDIIKGDAVARVRRLAVERIHDAAVLERIAHQQRRTDRKLARRARERLDDLSRRRAEAQAAAREREAVIAALRALAESPNSYAAHAERQRLLNRWHAHGEPSAGEQQRLADVLAMLDTLPPATSDDELQTLPEAHVEGDAREQEQAPKLETVLDEIFAAPEPSPEAVAKVQDLLSPGGNDSVAEPSEASARARAWLDAAQRYLEGRASLQAALAAGGAAVDVGALRVLEQRIVWPPDYPVPPLLQEARWLIAANEEVGHSRAQEEHAEQVERLQRQLAELETALGEGRLRPANRLLQRAEKLAQNIAGRFPAHLERRLRHATGRVAELRDWRRFAVQPKQEALCRAMEALVESQELPPAERARRVHELQSEWKATGGSESTQSRALWERFRGAADQAFEPCRQWFEAEAQRREANLLERGRICRQLAEFVEQAEWETIDVTVLEQIRHRAREEWRHFGPVERQHLGALRQEFEALMETLTEHIEAKRAAYRERKAKLVEQARALLEQDDAEAAAERAKRLQQDWKAQSQARPAADRALWKAFRAACDEIFAKRDAQRESRRSQADQSLTEGAEICARLEALVESREVTELNVLRREASQLESAFRSLHLPQGREARAMQARFDGLEDALAERVQRLESNAMRRELAEVKRLAELTRQWEEGSAGPIATSDDMELPKWLLEPLQRRWAAVQRGEPRGVDSQASRRICVRLEILAGIDSPPADETLRLELQVKRLAEGLGSGKERSPRREAQRLVAQWYGLPGEDALQGRVDAALQRLF